MSIGTGLLAIVVGGMLAAGVLEARTHARVLETIPLRVHVNGTRGKTSVTRAIATLFRELGKTTVGKCTGTLPVIIESDGSERRLKRRGRVRVQEQVRFLHYAARQRADAVVIECMAVDPMLQWICEHRFVQSHIGVITNVRRDHFEEMGSSIDEVARSLANTIPRHGVLVTGDARCAPLFEEVAASLGTRVVLVDDEDVRRAAERLGVAGAEVNDADGVGGLNEIRGSDETVHGGRPGVEDVLDEALMRFFAENVAIACTVARLAGFSESAVAKAAEKLPRPRLHATALDGDGHRLLVHAWSMNDTDSFRMLYSAVDERVRATDAMQQHLSIVPLYNHRSDRPLRALEFGRLFASEPGMSRVLVTGDPGGERLLRRAGVQADAIRTIPPPLTIDSVAGAVRDSGVQCDTVRSVSGPVVVLGCGNARGVEEFELGGQASAPIRSSVGVTS